MKKDRRYKRVWRAVSLEIPPGGPYDSAMSTWNQANHAASVCALLEQAVANANINDLRNDLRGLGPQVWRQWAAANRREIAKFAGSTEKERLKNKKWRDPTNSMRLTFAAWQIAYAGCALLDIYEQNKLFLDGASAGTATCAAYAYFDLQENLANLPNLVFEDDAEFQQFVIL